MVDSKVPLDLDLDLPFTFNHHQFTMLARISPRVHLVLRSFPTAARLHTLSSIHPQKLRKHTPTIPLLVRGVASSVSGRPASQTPHHAATNIREEVGNAASELAKGIAGANLPVDNVKPMNDTFVRAS